MTNDMVYLRQDVVAEPLFNQWYAWSYLISPMTAAMYIANSHLNEESNQFLVTISDNK